MKTLLLAGLAVMLSSSALANDSHLISPKQTVSPKQIGPDHGYVSMSAAEAKDASDDSLVVVRGYLVKRLSDEEYLFKDDSGTLTVEIDDHLWQSHQITDQDNILLKGEVDQDWDGTELDVRALELLPR